MSETGMEKGLSVVMEAEERDGSAWGELFHMG